MDFISQCTMHDRNRIGLNDIYSHRHAQCLLKSQLQNRQTVKLWNTVRPQRRRDISAVPKSGVRRAFVRATSLANRATRRYQYRRMVSPADAPHITPDQMTRYCYKYDFDVAPQSLTSESPEPTLCWDYQVALDHRVKSRRLEPQGHMQLFQDIYHFRYMQPGRHRHDQTSLD
jgi:hypothetical protein